jgi:hypothetical protein
VTEARWASWNELTGDSALAARPFTLSVIRKALDQAVHANPPENNDKIVTREPSVETGRPAVQEEPFP